MPSGALHLWAPDTIHFCLALNFTGNKQYTVTVFKVHIDRGFWKGKLLIQNGWPTRLAAYDDRGT